jgi:hypothetical protein
MKINPRAAIPPGGVWRWTAPNGRTLSVRTHPSKLLTAVAGYLAENSLPAMTTEEIEHAVCTQMGLTPPYCVGTDVVPVGRTTLSTLQSARRHAVEFFKNGMELAPMDEVNRRANICSTCPRNQPIGGCLDCMPEMAAEVATDAVVRADRRPTAYAKLHNCQQCGCRLALKTQLPDKGIFIESDQQFPEWCWIPGVANRNTEPPSS